jgi:hypothetical protein
MLYEGRVHEEGSWEMKFVRWFMAHSSWFMGNAVCAEGRFFEIVAG